MIFDPMSVPSGAVQLIWTFMAKDSKGTLKYHPVSQDPVPAGATTTVSVCDVYRGQPPEAALYFHTRYVTAITCVSADAADRQTYRAGKVIVGQPAPR